MPIAAIAVVIWSWLRPDWSILGFSSSGLKKIFGVIAVFTLIGSTAGSNETVEKQKQADAQQIFQMGKSNPAGQAVALAKADDEMLDRLKRIDPKLVAREQARRTDIARVEGERIEAANKEKIKVAVLRANGLPGDDLDGRIAAYRELVALAPTQSAYAEKLAGLESEKTRQSEIQAHPETGLELVDFSWTLR